MKHVLFYESVYDVMTKAPQHFPAHKERLDAFHARGDLLMVGTFGDPQREGSMSVFRTREAAESSRPATRSSSRAWSRAGTSATGTRCSSPTDYGAGVARPTGSAVI